MLNISGFVMAGGKSSRLGTDKAFIQIGHETMLKRMIRLLEPICKTVSISGYKPEYDVFNRQIIPDLYTGIGPISGICSVLKQSTTDWNLIVGVDLPNLSIELLHHLISSIGNYDCIVPIHSRRMEPLAALYHRNTLHVVETMITSRNYKLMNLLADLHVRFVDCNFLIKQSPNLFLNLNTPEDLRAI